MRARYANPMGARLFSIAAGVLLLGVFAPSAVAQGRPPVTAVERHGPAWTAELAGGLRAHVLTIGDPADPEAPVVVTATIDAGEQDEEAEDRGLARLVAFAMSNPQATGSGRPFEIVRQAGVGLRVAATPSGITATAWCKPATLDDALDAVAGALTSPSFDERTVAAWRLAEIEHQERFSESAAGLINQTLAGAMPGPQRALIEAMTPEEIEAVSAERGRAFYERHVLGSAARLAVAGAVEPVEAIGAIGEHFGQIGGREPRPQGRELFGLDSNADGLIEARAVVAPNRTLSDGQSLVAVGVSGIGMGELRRVRTLVLARGVLAERMDEGEQRGLAKGWTWLSPGYAFRDFGTLMLVAIVPTDEADATRARFEGLLSGLAQEGPDEASVASMRTALAASIDKQLSDPAWASRTMAEAEIVGFSIKDLLSIREDYGSITAADVARVLEGLWSGEGDAARLYVRVDASENDNAAATARRR